MHLLTHLFWILAKCAGAYAALALLAGATLAILERVTEGASSLWSLPLGTKLILVATTPIELSVFAVRALLTLRKRRK